MKILSFLLLIPYKVLSHITARTYSNVDPQHSATIVSFSFHFVECTKQTQVFVQPTAPPSPGPTGGPIG